MKKIEFGISDMIRVTLTEEGKKTLQRFWMRYHPDKTPDDVKCDRQGVLRRPLWQIMLIFGSSCNLHKEPLFVGNRIQIEVPDDGSCLYIEENSIHDSKARMYKV